MKLRGHLRFELDVLLQKRSKSLKGSRDDKIPKHRRGGRLMPLLLQVTKENAQAFVIAFGAAIMFDYLKNDSIGSSLIVMGAIIIALIFVQVFKLRLG